MSISLVWAQGTGGVIGKAGDMPWHLPEDLAHFKALTLNQTVVMGRRTWDSLPARFRPLVDRHNVVVTRQADWQSEGAERAGSLAAAIGRHPDAWIIGGGELYRQSIDTAERLEVTEIDVVVDGDTVAPTIDDSWTVASMEPAEGWATSRTGLRYRFVRYERA